MRSREYCDSTYVIVIDDAPDQFEDRFVQIGDERMIDVEVKHGYGLGLREVWIESLLVSTPPEGPWYGRSEEIGDGFKRYWVNKWE